MSTADLLLELIFSWIDQRERCAKQLRKLAEELESLREKCNAGQCVGSTVSVVGTACLIGAGFATLFTGGAAAPALGLLGAAYTGVGVTISVAAKIIEHFLSSGTMKEAQAIEKKSNEIEGKIRTLFQQLKAEKEAASAFPDPDEVDRHIMTEFLRAMARRSGLKQQHVERIIIRVHEDDFDLVIRPGAMRVDQTVKLAAVLGVLTFFTFQLSGKKYKLALSKGAEQLIKTMSSAGFKTALKGGAMVVGGAVGLAFALPEAIENWKDQIKKNHVTEASQSLRDTADALLKITCKLREQLNNMKKMFDEVAKCEREEEKLSREKVREEERRNQEAAAERQPGQRCMNYQLSEQQGWSDEEEDGEDKESDQVDSDQEESDQKESDQEESDQKESDQEESDQEESDQKESDQEDSDQEESDQEDSDQEESDQEDSDSEGETEDDESKQTGRKTKTKRLRGKGTRRADTQSEVLVVTHQTPPAAIRVGLLNVRSMNNKPSDIRELMTQNTVDVLATTETWLNKDTGDRVLHEASPENFGFHHEVRGSRGGGVAIQISSELDRGQIQFGAVTTFEYVAMVLQHDEWDEPVLMINLYRPPGNTRSRFRPFLDEFETLLDEVFKKYNSIIVTGDFNIWVDCPKMSSLEFDFLLLLKKLTQHVQEPTHEKGHTLDLVITRNVNISGLQVQDDKLSDHHTVLFNAWPASDDTKEEDEENKDEDEQTKRFKSKEE